jgi:hypothetical protein
MNHRTAVWTQGGRRWLLPPQSKALRAGVMLDLLFLGDAAKVHARKILEFPPTSRYKALGKGEPAGSHILLASERKEGINHDG